MRKIGPTFCVLLLALMTSAEGARLPSDKEQIARLKQEAFSPEYRLAIGSTQWKPVVAKLGNPTGGLIGGLIEQLWSTAERATLKGAYVGKTPLQEFDETLRDLLATKMPADAQVLDRSTYKKPKKAGANLMIGAASEPAKEQGFDGLLFVYLTPEMSNAPGRGKYNIRFNTHTVVRSLRNDKLLVTHVEMVQCPGTEPVETEQLADAIAECYPTLAKRVGELLSERLDARAEQ